MCPLQPHSISKKMHSKVNQFDSREWGMAVVSDWDLQVRESDSHMWLVCLPECVF